MAAAPGTIPALPYYQASALQFAGTEALEIVSNYANATAGVSFALSFGDLVGKAPSVMTTAIPLAGDMVAFYQTASHLPRACSIANLGVPAGNIPSGGATGQVLAKNSATNFDANWYNVEQLLATAFQTTVLTQNGVLYGNGANAIGATQFGTAGYFLAGNGSTLAPTFQQVNLTTGATGVLTVPFGGIGTNAVATGGILYGQGASAVGVTAFGAANTFLSGNGSTLAPTFAQVNLTQAVTGVLATTFGGLGTATLASHAIVLGSTGAAVAVVPSTTAGLVLVANGAAADPIYTSAVTLLGLGPAATAALGNIPGDVASTQALAGNIGEYTTANLTSGGALSLSTVSVATTIASIALAAGDWNVFGEVTFFATNTTTVGKILAAAVNNASNALPNFTSGAIHQLGLGSAGLTAIQTTCLPIGPVQFISSAVQTAYLIAAVNFTNATMGGFGVISARRAR